MKSKSPTSLSGALPRWECRNEHDAKELTDWTNAKLDEEQTITDSFIHAGDRHPRVITIERDQEAKERASNGDMTLLQELHPEFAEHLKSSTRKRGRPPGPEDGDVWEAEIDVGLILAIWKEHFGKFKRSLNDRVTAERIAADRWDVAVKAVRHRRKKKKPKPKLIAL